jgi:hypothetical protein
MDLPIYDPIKQAIVIVDQENGARRSFSSSDAIRQNTFGLSEGFPAGVPTSYNWYRGWNNDGQKRPPAGFTAVTGWGQIYHETDQPSSTNASAMVEVANAKTYVHLRSTRKWVLVQEQAINPLSGGHFVTDFKGNAAIPMPLQPRTEGWVAFSAPPLGYNNHFWPTARGTFADGSVDAVYVQMDMRVDDPNSNLVASVGADWWRDATAPYVDDHSNNPGAGSSNWVNLSNQWKTLAFYSMSTTQFKTNLPPSVLESTLQTSPKITLVSSSSGVVRNEITNATTLTLTGTAEAGSIVRIFDNSSPIGTVKTSANGAWSFTTARLANGHHRFTANATDLAGTVGSMSSELTIKIDTRRSPSTKR